MQSRFALAVLASLALLAAPGAPAVARSTTAPVTLLLAARLSDGAGGDMTQALWQKLVGDYANVEKVVPFTGTGSPTIDECRAAGALYALTAVFEPVSLADASGRDNDRKYATARLSMVNCLTGRMEQPLAIPLQSDKLSTSSTGDFEPSSDLTWTNSVRSALGHSPPLAFAGVARITRIDGPFVYITTTGVQFRVNQVLRVFADKNVHVRPAVELVVNDLLDGRTIQTSYDEARKDILRPNVGDYVEAATLGAPR